MHTKWRKSSRSNDNGQCVEMACTHRARMVRDSKSPDSGVLQFDQLATERFLSAVRAGRFDG